jgi:hypothetical protein
MNGSQQVYISRSPCDTPWTKSHCLPPNKRTPHPHYYKTGQFTKVTVIVVNMNKLGLVT